MIKKAKINIIKILLIIVILIAPFTVFFTVKADSGWDSDYDYGGYSGGYDYGGYDYGGYDYDYDDYDYGGYSGGYSSWWYDSGSHSGSSSGPFEFSPMGFLLFILILAAIVLYVYWSVKSQNKLIKDNYIINPIVDFSIINEFSDIDEDKIKTIFPDATIGYLKNIAYNNFVEIQKAWMDFDYDKLRSLCTDELYNSYLAQLETLELKNSQNIMSHFKLRKIIINDIVKNKKTITLSVVLCVSFLDYVVDKKTNQVTRGLKNQLITNNYKLTYVISSKIDNNKKELKCPNCGAKLTNKASNKCEYCDTVVVTESHEFVLSKKTNINK